MSQKWSYAIVCRLVLGHNQSENEAIGFRGQLTTFPIAVAKKSMTWGFLSVVLVRSKNTLAHSSTMISARSYADRISFFLTTFNRLLMLAWTADGSGLFLPYLFGKLVIIVSASFISTFRELGKEAREIVNSMSFFRFRAKSRKTAIGIERDNVLHTPF